MSRILIVDDKEENIYYLQALLTGHGYVVELARHGAEALVKARQSPPDAIISDLLMPVMDGYTLLRLWKADARLKTVPFIVYTATYTDPEDERLALSLGADTFILKPSEPEDFLARLRQVQETAANGGPVPAKDPAGNSAAEEKELLKVYSERLIRKLEEKTLQLEESNRALQKDIAERKRAEQALRDSEEKFSKIFQSSPIAMTVSTLNEGRYLDVNREFLRILQRTREEMIGHTAAELQVWARPEDRDAVMATIKEQGNLRNLEMEIRNRSGQFTPILWSAEPMVIAGEACLLGSSLDLTELKRTDEELRWKTAFLEAQVDSSLDGILVIDSAGKKLLQNQRMNDLWKIPPAIAEHEDDAAQVKYVTSQTKNPRQFVAKVAYLYSHPDAVSRDEIELNDGTILDRYSSPVRDKTGKYYGRIWIFRDMTEHRKLEARLRQAQKMEAFGQLAGGVAHDFNNILAVIQLQAGMLKTDPGISLQQLNVASDIEKASERAANLTRQLLLFSRQQTMQPHDLNLKDVVANIATMLQRTLGVQIQLQFKFSEQSIMIHADAGMIDQILLNLTVNARDAMPKGGQIIIETLVVEFDEVTATQTAQARPGSFACLSVSDTGCGISPEIRARIFEPFFTTKDVGKGTGLGLATIYGIVNQHKGWINVYSEVGQGTTFRVYLPRLTHAAVKATAVASPTAMRGGHETILLVEDEPALLASVRTALLRLGYRVLEATNSDEALAIWKQKRDGINLLLTDLVMPGQKTGKELAEQLLQQDPDLKVIYTSGYSAEIAGKDFPLEEGVNFLTKPFEAIKLAQTVRNRLDKK